jgi:manganese-dependent inorganic pyrophosphatase
MNEILIIGNKNPDAGAICSAYSYAYLKNKLDSSKIYTAAICGSINKQAKYIFDKFNLTPPIYISDIYLRVNDIMTKNVFYIRENDPFWIVLKSINDMKIRLVPIVNDNNVLSGVISIPEVANFFSNLDAKDKPKYLLRIENFPKVVPGYFIKNAEIEEFSSYFLVGAMPFEHFKQKLDLFNPNEVVLIVGDRKDVIEYAISKQILAIVLTGIDNSDGFDFSNFNGWVYVSTKDTAETLRLLALSVPSKAVMGESPVAKEGDYVEQIGNILKNDYHRGMPVVDENGKLKGILTRSDFIKRKKREVILIDHNEFSQAVDGIEEARVVEIVEHHRLSSMKTNLPINVYAKPAGSSCTLVYQLFKFNSVDIPKEIASVLLAGLLSDTVILKSPTTTQEDIEAASNLSDIANLDVETFGNEILV